MEVNLINHFEYLKILFSSERTPSRRINPTLVSSTESPSVFNNLSAQFNISTQLNSFNTKQKDVTNSIFAPPLEGASGIEEERKLLR